MRRSALLLIALAIDVAFSACHKESAEDHFKKGNVFFDQEKWPEAIVEYRSTLQLAPKRGDAYSKLSDAYLRKGDARNAIGAAVRAADALPNDITAQVRAGSMLLVARAFTDAEARARKALALDPKSADALILMGNAKAGLKDVDSAMADYQEAIALAPDKEAAYANIGALNALRGKMPEAEASYRKAVDVAPKSVSARLALASFLMSTNRAADAEKEIKDALALDPNNTQANRALGLFYIVSNRIGEAEPYFKAIAKSSDTEISNLSLADYYMLAKRPEDARKVLTDLSTREKSYAVATTRLAALDASQGLRAQALKRLGEVIAKQPKEMAPRLLQAQLLMADGKPADALAQAQSIVKEEPTAPASGDAFALIGNIEVQSDHPEEATAAYTEALKRRAQPVSSSLALAAINLSTHALDKAESYAKDALAAQPGNPLARAMLVRVLLAQGKTSNANDEIASLQKQFPNSPTVLNLIAAQHVAKGEVGAARTAYAKAAAIAPNSQEAMIGLTAIDLRQGRKQEAVARIEQGFKTLSANGDFLLLAARTYGTAGDLKKAEEMLKKTIEVAPNKLTAYGMLGQLYASQRRLDDAKDQFQELVKRNPKSVPANTMLGMLDEAQGKTSEAIKQYETVLLLDSHAAVASNNLAWLYVSSKQNLDKALEMAQTAHQQLPDEPHVNDTLGWAYYQKEQFAQAVPPLEASIRVDSSDPSVHFHLGMAYFHTAEMEKAKQALKQALKMNGNFDGAVEARKTLDAIGR